MHASDLDHYYCCSLPTLPLRPASPPCHSNLTFHTLLELPASPAYIPCHECLFPVFSCSLCPLASLPVTAHLTCAFPITPSTPRLIYSVFAYTALPCVLLSCYSLTSIYLSCCYLPRVLPPSPMSYFPDSYYNSHLGVLFPRSLLSLCPTSVLPPRPLTYFSSLALSPTTQFPCLPRRHLISYSVLPPTLPSHPPPISCTSIPSSTPTRILRYIPHRLLLGSWSSVVG